MDLSSKKFFIFFWLRNLEIFLRCIFALSESIKTEASRQAFHNLPAWQTMICFSANGAGNPHFLCSKEVFPYETCSKKVLSSMMVGCMLVSAGAISAGAVESAPQTDWEGKSGIIADDSCPPTSGPSYIIEEEMDETSTPGIAPRYTKSVKFTLEPGDWQEIESFSAEYPRGTVVTITGSWIPTDAPLDISLQGRKGGGFSASLSPGKSRSFTLINTGVWTLEIGSSDDYISGSITIHTEEP